MESSSAVPPPLDGTAVVADLQWLLQECEQRCITDGAKWASEVLMYVPEERIRQAEESEKEHGRGEKEPSMSFSLSLSNRPQILGRTLLLSKDFSRAVFFLAQTKKNSDKHLFLYFWARYLCVVHENLENDVESIERRAADQDDDEQMALLYLDLTRIEDQVSSDPFLLYLYGKVQRALLMPEEAKNSFMEAIRKEPRLWLAWEELVDLVDGMPHLNEVKSLGAGHWHADWFEAKVLPRMHYHVPAIAKADELRRRGLGEQPMLIAHSATSYNMMHEHDPAIERFMVVHKMDPYRIEQMNLLSDSLYIRGERVSLSSLAHSFFRTHKYFWETCCIVANYYSMRGEHEPSIRFLQRALRLNPHSSSTWTLIGHEFMELKNNSAACMSYRKAIEIDPRDHRGWYGLGQLYDILKMHTFSLFYYQQAHKCKPMDSRMLVALGEVYMKALRINDAEKCFIKAFKVGDVEGTALLMLAKLYEQGGQNEQATVVYEKYLSVYYEARMEDANVPGCLRFLAKFYLDKGDLESATSYGQRCTEHDSVREEGRSILRQVSQRRQRMLPRNSRGSRSQAMQPPSPILPAPPPMVEDDDMAISDGEGDQTF